MKKVIVIIVVAILLSGCKSKITPSSGGGIGGCKLSEVEEKCDN